MQKLLDLFTKVLAFLVDLKAHANEATTALARSRELIADLQAKLDAANADHTALLARADAAEAHAKQLDADALAINDQASTLAAAINLDPLTPQVDTTTLAVTGPAPVAPVEPAATDGLLLLSSEDAAKVEFDAGANLAREGKPLPDDASSAARDGFDSVTPPPAA